MSKGRYRSVDVETVKVDVVLKRLGSSKKTTLGVDLAKHKMRTAVLDTDKKVVLTFKWEHPRQTEPFLDLVRQLSEAVPVDIAMEATGTYGDTLRVDLGALPVRVFQVKGKLVHSSAESYDGVPSLHDAKSAAIIGDLHLSGKSREWRLETADERNLKGAVRTLLRYQSQEQQAQGQLEARLARHWPGIEEVLATDSQSLLKLLSTVGACREVARHSEQARTCLEQAGGAVVNRKRIEAVLHCAQTSRGLALSEGEQWELRELSLEMLRLQTKIAEAKRQTEELGAVHEPVQAMSAHVVGRLTAAILYNELGDPRQYGSARAYEKAAGLNLKERSSGQDGNEKKKKPLHITRWGSGLVRKYLYLATLRLIQHDAVVKAWYTKAVAADGLRKMRALVAVMRKLIRALWHVSHGEAFDSRKLFNVGLLAEFGEDESGTGSAVNDQKSGCEESA